MKSVEEKIEFLAKHFTGPDVAVNSIALALPDRYEQAKAWFNVREALGISGYMEYDVAKKIITEVFDGRRYG